MSSAEVVATAQPAAQRPLRFAVAWRNTTLKRIYPVGALDFDGYRYHFQYLPHASDLPGFRPFIGFPRIVENYSSTRLWPFFALRAMDRRRPDFGLYVTRLGLTEDASVLDVLSRSGGEVQGDVTVTLTEEPHIGEDGATEYVFLVRGARHATAQYDSAGAVDLLRADDPLVLVPDSSNPVNSDALLISTADGASIGWVPDLLTPYFRALADQHADLRVLRNNGPDAPWHLRLLVLVRGNVNPKLSVFSGSQWPKSAPVLPPSR